jgi:IPT/TIG domain/Subtilase family
MGLAASYRRQRYAAPVRSVLSAVFAGLVFALAGATAASAASAPRHLVPPKLRRLAHAGPAAVSATPSKTRPYYACPAGACEAIVDPAPVRTSAGYALPAGGPLLEGGGEKGGYDPQELRAAYDIPATGGSTQTIALVDAYGYASAEADLAHYRERYGLAPCTKANGCFKKVNQSGEEGKYPGGEGGGWEAETALDLDMASAACPQCHILLVQASGEFAHETGEAANTAASLGATEISNSYGYPEDYAPWCGTTGCAQYSADYDHPGVVVTASAGDSGYDDSYWGLAAANFPSSTPYVIAVGGTSLHKAANSRGWSEEVWNEPGRALGTGGGCSKFQPKPTWQADAACAMRTDNDVAADAACETAVSVYSSYFGGWEDLCGTSASAPLVAGIAAHEDEAARLLGADAFYQEPAALFDVTAGASGTCTPPAEDLYLCTAGVGYDGPTGLGAPRGSALAPSVTAVQPGEGPPAGATSVTIAGANFADATAVDFGASAAASFTVDSPGEITAVSPPGSGTVDVTVTTPEGTSAANPGDRFSYSFAYPELGRCTRTAKGLGAYRNATCTLQRAGGSYAWTPGVAKNAFSGHGGKSSLETVGRRKIECAAQAVSGAYAGTRELEGVVIALTGCQMRQTGACTSAGAATGEIRTSTLQGELQWQSRAARKVVLDLAPAEVSGPFASFACATVPVLVRGSVLAAVKADRMALTLAPKYFAWHGVQSPASYETPSGSVGDVLEMSVAEGAFEQAGLTVAAATQTGEEALEINAYF